MVRPLGAVTPAMKPTTGLVLFARIQRAGLDLEVTANLADHHNALGLVVRHKELDRLEGGGADDRVTADADGRGLAEAGLCALVHRFVGQCARLGHDSDDARLEDEAS